MKLVIALIQPEMLPDVKKELFKSDIHKITVSNAIGCGEQLGYREVYRGVKTEVDLLPKTRIEIAVNEDFVRATIDAIIRGAKTGNIGDGKIFVIPLDECVRIRTGETGKTAIG